MHSDLCPGVNHTDIHIRKMKMPEVDSQWEKMSRMPKPSTRKIILDALEANSKEENIIGKPDAPVLPLVGSLNVNVHTEELGIE